MKTESKTNKLQEFLQTEFPRCSTQVEQGWLTQTNHLGFRQLEDLSTLLYMFMRTMSNGNPTTAVRMLMNVVEKKLGRTLVVQLKLLWVKTMTTL